MIEIPKSRNVLLVFKLQIRLRILLDESMSSSFVLQQQEAKGLASHGPRNAAAITVVVCHGRGEDECVNMEGKVLGVVL